MTIELLIAITGPFCFVAGLVTGLTIGYRVSRNLPPLPTVAGVIRTVIDVIVPKKKQPKEPKVFAKKMRA